MPISNILHLPAVVHFATSLKPRAILDIGVGTGTYGFLLRQFLDVALERISPFRWETVIDGIEIFDSYRNPVWDYAYDSITIGDIRQHLPDAERYDVVLCNDVLEHFEQRDASTLIDQLLDRCGVLIASTPSTPFPQGAWGGNEAEAHKCLLKRSDFPDLVASKQTGVTACFVCSRQSAWVTRVRDAAATCPECFVPSRSFIRRLNAKRRELTKLMHGR